MVGVAGDDARMSLAVKSAASKWTWYPQLRFAVAPISSKAVATLRASWMPSSPRKTGITSSKAAPDARVADHLPIATRGMVVPFVVHLNPYLRERPSSLFPGDSDQFQLDSKLAIHIATPWFFFHFALGVVMCSLLLRMDASHFSLILKNFFLLMQKKAPSGISPEGAAYQAARGK